MGNTFIKTSKGIIRIESINFISLADDRRFDPPTGETAIRIYFSSSSVINSGSIILQGEEAKAFLQVTPLAVDLTLSKPKLAELGSDGRQD